MDVRRRRRQVSARTGLTLEDLAVNYFGNRSSTRLETAVRGPMTPFTPPQVLARVGVTPAAIER